MKKGERIPDAYMIEYYGPAVRIGVEGKWVEFVMRDYSLSKRDYADIITDMDRLRTQ
jgi:hypothetical protein